MSSTYKDIKSALAAVTKKLQKAVDESLKTEVADEVRDAEIAAIGSVVYDAYGNNDTKEPNVYVRRYDDGGLVDRNNMPAEVSKGELSVWNLTPANSEYGHEGYFAGEIVINGGPYDYPVGENTFGDFHPPRDFIGETYSSLRGSKAHVNALKKGLINQGFVVK